MLVLIVEDGVEKEQQKLDIGCVSDTQQVLYVQTESECRVNVYRAKT